MYASTDVIKLNGDISFKMRHTIINIMNPWKTPYKAPSVLSTALIKPTSLSFLTKRFISKIIIYKRINAVTNEIIVVKKLERDSLTI